MGLCYSLRPRLFGDPSGSISNAATNSDSEQPPELSVPMRAGDVRHGDLHRTGTLSAGAQQQLRDGQPRRGELCKAAKGDSPDGLLLQNGGGSGPGDSKQQQHKPSKGQQAQQQVQQQHPLQKGWDKLRLEEKEAEKEAKKVSKSIDRVLKEQKREYKQTHRLLLLGGDEDDEAGPSSAAGRPTPSIPEPGVQSGPMDILAMMVQEEILPGPSMEEEVVFEEESFFIIQEDSGSFQEDTTIPDQPTTPPTITSSPSRASPSRASPSIVAPSPSPSVRARASPPPRKALSKTRDIPSSLRQGLQEEQARQTRHLGAMVGDLRRVADSLASTSTSVQHALTLHAGRDQHVSQSLEELSGNSSAMVTCLVEQQGATALLTAEVSRLAAAVEANNAAVREEGRVTRRHQRNNTTRQMRMLAQTNTILARLANAMEGMQPPPARSLEVGVDAPPPLHPHPMPPPHHGD